MFRSLDGICVAVCLGTAALLAGCNIDGRWAQSGGPVDVGPQAAETARTGVDLSIVEGTEVDLVESVVSLRTQYEHGLKQLQLYYQSRGHGEKAEWAAFELRGLKSVKQFRYLMDAEVAAESLRPTDLNPEADSLFQQGRDLMRKGGHGVPAIYRRDRMVEAAKVFRNLIERFPSSDKIDDAAFFLGEIHKEYLPDQEAIAVKWYERAWTWNPETPHPARFQAAVICDYRLHDRDRALELYQDVLTYEASNATNVRWATRRIEELSGTARTARAPQPS